MREIPDENLDFKTRDRLYELKKFEEFYKDESLDHPQLLNIRAVQNAYKSGTLKIQSPGIVTYFVDGVQITEPALWTFEKHVELVKIHAPDKNKLWGEKVSNLLSISQQILINLDNR